MFNALNHCATAVDKEMAKRKEMFSTLDIKHKQKRFYRRFPIYAVWGGGGALIKLFLFQGALIRGGGGLKEGGRLLEDLPYRISPVKRKC